MSGAECERCGQIHERCKAHTRAGNPCKQPPMAGQRVCRMHGGKQPAAMAKAARRLAEERVAATIADVVVHPIDNPLDELAALTAEAKAWKQHLANAVAELSSYRFTDDKGGEQLNAYVALLERAMDRLQKYLTDWARLGFEERKARLDDARAALVATVIQGVLTELGHPVDDDHTITALDRWLPVLDGNNPPAITARSVETP